ncbi:FIST signal transduction protein [Persicimonas caeni]|nr:FIST N-terminal domain-containing protein [Persicimonas caeni]
MSQSIFTSHTSAGDAAEAARELTSGFADADIAVAAFFCAPDHDIAAVGEQLVEALPDAQVIGCTTAGEFTGTASSTDGVSLFALSADAVADASAALIEFGDDVAADVEQAADAVADELGVSLREASADEYIGFVLIDGLSGKEEAVNRALGNVAPTLNFVGGSAGDNLAFEKTEVFCNGKSSASAAVILLAHMSAPFEVVKSCSFEPTDASLTITKADEDQRIVWEFDGKPAVEAYAEAVGVAPDAIDSSVFMSSPVGLMLGDEPWIRSPQQAVDGGGIKFYCSIKEGMQVSVMRSTDLVGETQTHVAQACDRLDGEPAGILAFNCILRRLELDADDAHEAFRESFPAPVAGFHTYGESWLGHINQTLTAVVFGG